MLLLGALLVLAQLPAGAQDTPPGLESPLRRLRALLDGVASEAFTRVLSARPDLVWLEPVEGVRAGEIFEVFPIGTVIAGPGQPEVLPAPLNEVVIQSIEADALTAKPLNLGLPLPSFAPARRKLADRSLAIVYDLSDQEFEGLRALGFPEAFYTMLFADFPLPLSKTPWPGITGSVETNPALIDAQATEIVIIARTPDGLRATYETWAGGAQGFVMLDLPGFGAERESVLDPKLGTTIPLARHGEAFLGRLPGGTETCLPLNGGTELWCLTPRGLLGMRFSRDALVVTDRARIDWPLTPPLSRHPAARMLQIGEEIWTSRGAAQTAVRLARVNGLWEVAGTASEVPVDPQPPLRVLPTTLVDEWRADHALGQWRLGEAMYVWQFATDESGAAALIGLPEATSPGETAPAAGPAHSTTPLRLGLPVGQLDLTPMALASPLQYQLASAIYDTPLRVGPNKALQAAAALEVERNATHDEYWITLRPAQSFHDGTPVTADAAILGWLDTIRTHPLHAPAFENVVGYAGFLEANAPTLAGLEASGERTIHVTLTIPDAEFPRLLTDPTWSLVRFPAKYFGSTTTIRTATGSGPYVVTKVTGKVVALSAHRNHWAGRPWLDTLNWHLLGSARALTRTYLTGSLDLAPLPLNAAGEFAPPTTWSRHRRFGDLHLTTGLLVNPNSATLGDAGTRRALLDLADPDELARITFGGHAVPARGHFTASVSLPSESGTLPATRALILAYPIWSDEALAVAERVKARLQAAAPRLIVSLLPMVRLADLDAAKWDALIWTLPGDLQPDGAEAAELAQRMVRWGATIDSRATPAQLEAALARRGLWRPLIRPESLWLASPRLSGLFPAPSGVPDWPAAYWTD